MRRRLLVASVAALASAAGAALGPRYGGEIAVVVPGLPATTAPHAPRSLADRFVLGLVHETLVELDADGWPAPALASGWSSAAAGREWSLRLAPALRSHAGRPLEAADVVRSLRRFLRSQSIAAQAFAETLEGGPQFRSGASEALPGLDSRGADGIVLRLATPLAQPFAPLASAAAAITDATGSGFGPFVPAQPVPGAAGLALAAFGSHRRGRPYLDALRVLPHDTRPVDARLLLGSAEDADLGRSPGGVLRATPALILLVFNPSQPPFDSSDARQRIAASLDRASLVRHLLAGGVASPALLPPELLPTAPLPGDSSGRGSLRARAVLSVEPEVPPLVSQRVAAELLALGLELTVSTAGDAGQAPALRLRLWTPELPDAALALRELHALGPALPEVAADLETAERTSDAALREATLKRVERTLRERAWVVAVAAAPMRVSLAPRLQDARLTRSGRLVLEDAWVTP